MMRRVVATHLRGLAERSARTGSRWASTQAAVPIEVTHASHEEPTPTFRSARVMPGAKAELRNDWTREEIQAIYDMPFVELLYRAATVHRMFFNPREVQQCTLISIKTGGCTEDCKYCSQSVRYKTHVKPTPQMKVAEVVEAAKRAKEAGSTRFCMGAAWRELGNKKNAFNHILDMVQQINGMGLEVCATLGMLNEEQAKQLKNAGLTAYNHNLDTSREFYPKVITTRTYDDRLETIANVRRAGISVCSGGILGLGESQQDRIGLLHTLSTLPEHPESVPINALVSISGTPLGSKDAPTIWDMGRMIATARIVMPKTMVRLSAGRLSFSPGEQALMFMAGANSIFTGDKLLTTPNPEFDQDAALFQQIGLVGKPAHKPPLETPYPVHDAAAAEAAQDDVVVNHHRSAPQEVVVTRTQAAQTMAA